MPLQRRIPKYGFKNFNRTEYQVINLDIIQKLTDNKKIDLFFSLGKAYEDVRNFDKSYYYLNEANKLRYEKHGSNLENEKKLFDHIIRIFEKINLEECHSEIPTKKIIFICGMWFGRN